MPIRLTDRREDRCDAFMPIGAAARELAIPIREVMRLVARGDIFALGEGTDILVSWADVARLRAATRPVACPA